MDTDKDEDPLRTFACLLHDYEWSAPEMARIKACFGREDFRIAVALMRALLLNDNLIDLS